MSKHEFGGWVTDEVHIAQAELQLRLEECREAMAKARERDRENNDAYFRGMG